MLKDGKTETAIKQEQVDGIGLKKMNQKMVITLGRWEKLENGKWRLKKEYQTQKKNWYDPEEERRLMSKLAKHWVYCEDCEDKYNLADPCIHHLSDSPAHRKKYDAWKKANKLKMEKAQSPEVDEASKQERLK